MGFFSLPLARMVGPKGRVVCVDLQQKMLDLVGSSGQEVTTRGVGIGPVTLQITDDLKVAAGFRFDRYEEDDKPILNPNFAARNG